MASGVEILGYTGNAALGLGGDVSSISTGTDNLADFNKTLASLQQQDAVWNQMQYRQKIDDRDSTLKLLADQQNKLDIPVLDSDRPALEAKMKEIDDAFLANPDLKSNPEAYQKMQKHIRDFNGMTTSAKTRAATMAQMKLEYANNPDSEDRQRLGSYISEQEKTPVDHLIDPYQKEQSFDMKNVYLKVPTTPSIERWVDKEGKHLMRTTNKASFDDIFDAHVKNSIEGPGKNTPNQWRSIWEHAQVNPDFMSDKNLLYMNKQMEDLNKKEELVKGDPRYREPVGVKDENGNWKLNVNPFDLALNLDALESYFATPGAPMIDKPAQDAALKAEQQRTQKSIQGLNYQKGKTENAKRNALNAKAALDAKHGNYYDALIDKVAKEGTQLDDKHKKMVSEGMGPVAQAMEAMYSAHQDTRSIADVSKLGSELRKQIGAQDGSTYSDLPVSDPRYLKLVSTPVFGTGADNAGKFLGISVPDRIMVVRGPGGRLNGSKLVGLDKDGKAKDGTDRWKVHKISDLNTAYIDIIQADNGYRKTDKTVALENASRYAQQLGQGNMAAGTDAESFIKNLGVIPSTSAKDESLKDDDQSDDQTDESDDGDQTDDYELGADEAQAPITSFKSKDVIREDGKPAYVMVKGQKKKVVGVKKKTGAVVYKK